MYNSSFNPYATVIVDGSETRVTEVQEKAGGMDDQTVAWGKDGRGVSTKFLIVSRQPRARVQVYAATDGESTQRNPGTPPPFWCGRIAKGPTCYAF